MDEGTRYGHWLLKVVPFFTDKNVDFIHLLYPTGDEKIGHLKSFDYNLKLIGWYFHISHSEIENFNFKKLRKVPQSRFCYSCCYVVDK